MDDTTLGKYGSFKWLMTRHSTTVNMTCPYGATGSDVAGVAYRRCKVVGNAVLWLEPNYAECKEVCALRLISYDHVLANKTHNLDHHLYADDTQMYLSLATPNTNCFLNQLSNYLQNIFHWTIDSELKLSGNKTEFLIIGTLKQRGKLGCFSRHLC